jgi:hypothetical protein
MPVKATKSSIIKQGKPGESEGTILYTDDPVSTAVDLKHRSNRGINTRRHEMAKQNSPGPKAFGPGLAFERVRPACPP